MVETESPDTFPPPFNAAAFTRPDPALHRYYVIISLFATIGFPLVYIPLLIRYNTMRYHFDDDGVSMAYGYFFRKEVYLTYRRLQDIHVTRNLIERWLGIAKVPIQTASGTSGATMKFEGVRDAEGLRDYLSVRMRGARDDDQTTTADTTGDDVTVLLREIRDAIRERCTP